jgi:hypothetical protein
MDAAQETRRFEQMFFAPQATQERMGIGLFPLFLVVDELMNGELCLPFGDLGLRKREYRSFWQAENESLADGRFCDVACRSRPRDRAIHAGMGDLDRSTVLARSAAVALKK